MELIKDDSLIYLRTLNENSIDSLVTDPPAFISFMGKEWDGFDKLNHISDIFKECFRVLKPGAYGVVWALPRTSHHTAKALEDSGFEIRDIIHHVQGQGFPKSLNIGKAFEKKNNPELAKKYSGYGTAIKPSVEHWILIRKCLSEKTVVDNVEKWGTGGLNIGETRVKTLDNLNGGAYYPKGQGQSLFFNKEKSKEEFHQPTGRFPANLVHDGSEEVEREFLEQGGIRKSNRRNPPGREKKIGATGISYGTRDDIVSYNGDSGLASRFFNSLPDDIDTTFIYQSKASTSERNNGCKEILTWENVDLNQELTELSQLLKDISEDIVQNLKDIRWNIELFGKESLEKSQQDLMFIIKIISKLITELKILNLNQSSTIKESIQVAIKMISGSGINLVENVERLSELQKITTAERTAFLLGVNLVVAKMLSSIMKKGKKGNVHSTVKSIALMSHLIKLTTPPNGICLDPFMGSGSTGVACAKNGFDFIGIEQHPEYFEIAKARISHASA